MNSLYGHVLIPILLGVISNLVTHVVLKWFLRRSPRLGTEESRPAAGAELSWSLLPVSYSLAALILARSYWPLGSLGTAVLLGGSLLLALAIVFTLSLLKSRWSPQQLLLGGIIMGVGLPVFSFLLLDLMLPNFVALDCPSKVDDVTTLKGRIVDPDWRIYLLLHPSGTYSPEVVPVPPAGKNGVWYKEIHFGGTDSFRISALAISPEDYRSIKSKPPPEVDWLFEKAPYRTEICQLRRMP